MDSMLSVSNKGSPVNFHDDSGFGSMQRTLRGEIAYNHTGNLKGYNFQPNSSYPFTCVAYSGFNGGAKRPLISSAETIKKRLFESPYASEEVRSWLNSPENAPTPSPVGRTKQRVVEKVTEDLNDFLLNSKTKNKELLPKCPASPLVKFYYSPLKNSKLFRIPAASPQKSAADTREAPSAKSWGVLINLPQQCCDVLKKLANRNVTAGLSVILSYLSERDVYRASCVSREWKQIVSSDLEARRKRESFVQKRLCSKENKKNTLTKEDEERGNENDCDRELLLDVTNRVFTKSSLSSRSPIAKSDCFIEVAKSIPKTEVVLKCPMCQYPAKCLMGNKYGCTRDLCKYAFCRECLGSHPHSNSCLVLQAIPKLVIGSKRCKQNLRRL